jgi:hypothetical protein
LVSTGINIKAGFVVRHLIERIMSTLTDGIGKIVSRALVHMVRVIVGNLFTRSFLLLVPVPLWQQQR